ncbi:methylthioribose-1-phosphate isomerase [Desulfurella multipotens]|uniref:S-methyl-5-thioribose-1-phosphate isomerase n=1 Tax=Desulfurella multipotens TaxID=79269 RepID=A0A1G6K067_9BACT|nr:S-methyl-5-thioribose-1-phosphate isomerase [Desulfurella multipotens]SDC24278.1 methylthioribose-1-phosphate isomerase [Desulfurella multipotens]
MGGYSPFIFTDNDEFIVIDQRFLPQIKKVKLENLNDTCMAIKDMIVRGAPLIGIVAAFGYYLAIKNAKDLDELNQASLTAYTNLLATRPTAVNLKWAVESQKKLIEQNAFLPVEKIIKKVRANAFGIFEDQKKADYEMAKNALVLFDKKMRILTHCNTGSFATGGIGTALGIIKYAAQQNLVEEVYVDETRPYFQGSRITAFELSKENINYKIVTDSACGILMQKKLIDCIIVGADRIAKNGDVANKVGTYCLAQLAKLHNVKFFVAAPESTIDRSLNNLSDLDIEIRDSSEILNFNGVNLAPDGAKALYFAFDVTPNYLIDSIITEKGIYRPDFEL